jgi:hypothetical protein
VAEAKPFASLSSGLLARKGAARPAMKPQGFGQMGGGNLEDLGWNDMGFEPPKPTEAPRDEDHDAFGEDVVEHPRAHPTGLTPVQSPVHTQQAEIADRLGESDEGEEEELDETAEVFEPEAEAPAYEAEAPAYEAEPAEAPEYEDEAPAYEAEPAEPVYQRPIKAAVAAVTPTPAPRRAPKARSVAGGKGKAAFTLRLDPSRHLKLRLACAVNGRSAQQIVTDALDGLLQNMPELDAMAEKANRKG